MCVLVEAPLTYIHFIATGFRDIRVLMQAMVGKGRG